MGWGIRQRRGADTDKEMEMQWKREKQIQKGGDEKGNGRGRETKETRQKERGDTGKLTQRKVIGEVKRRKRRDTEIDARQINRDIGKDGRGREKKRDRKTGAR